MTRLRHTFAKTLVLALAALVPGLAAAQRQPAYRPRITLDAARSIALGRMPGRIRHQELEREHGRWIYSFEIVGAWRGIEEVNIDSDTGAIVAVEHEVD